MSATALFGSAVGLVAGLLALASGVLFGISLMETGVHRQHRRLAFVVAAKGRSDRSSSEDFVMGQLELHNKLAGEIVASIVRPPIEAGGSYTDVLVLAESVLVGVALACIKLGGDNTVLDVMVERAKERLAEIRLKDLNVGGRA